MQNSNPSLAAVTALRDSGRADEALAVSRKVNIVELRGVWRSNMLITLGETLIAAGRTDEALVTYRQVLADTGARAADKRAAEIAIDAFPFQQSSDCRSPPRRIASLLDPTYINS